MKKPFSLLLTSALLFGAVAPVANAAGLENEQTFGIVVNEKEGNNSQNTAQKVELRTSKYDSPFLYSSLVGGIQEGDEDWYEVTLNEIGRFTLEFWTPEGKRLTKDVPQTQIFTTTTNGVFEEYLSPTAFTNHIKGNKLFVKLSSTAKVDYVLRLHLAGNPENGNKYEPNNIFDFEYNFFEYATVPNGDLISTSFENKFYDLQDNFAIVTGKNKGTLNFDIHHSKEEYNYWKERNYDFYTTYNVFAELKNGSFKRVHGKAVIGLPESYSAVIEINDKNFTGKYAVNIRNYLKHDFNYKFKLQFVSEGAPVDPPVEPGEPSEPPAEPGKPTEPTEPPIEPGKPTEPTEPPAEPGKPTEPTEPPAEPEKPTQPEPPANSKVLERISGNDRYETSREFTKKIKDKSLDYVILASGSNFPDALTGGVLSNKLNGTVMLVNDREKVIGPTINEIKRLLKPNGKVLLLGGDVALPEAIESKMKKNFIVERVAGIDRVATAIQIADKVNSNPNEVFLVNGKDFADSLAIVPRATKTNTPILLNLSNKQLNGKVQEYLSSKKIKKVTIIGGENVIGNEIKSSLNKMGITTSRIAGTNRYKTSLEIAKTFYPNSTKVGISNGWVFADALSGSQFANSNDMPILLSHKDKVDPGVNEYLKQTKNVYIYGGESVLNIHVK